MILTTTGEVQGYRVTKYHGIVTSHVIQGVNFMVDWAASIRDMVGGRTKSMEKELSGADSKALSSLMEQAKEAGGNGVIGISIDYEPIALKGTMLMIVATGTVVTLIEEVRAEDRAAPAAEVKSTSVTPAVRPEVPVAALASEDSLSSAGQFDRYGPREFGAEFRLDR